VANDVAKTLRYSKPRLAVSSHCKGAAKHSVLTPGGRQKVTIIPERDVYRLVMRSRLPAAEQFEEEEEYCLDSGHNSPATPKDQGLS